MNYRRMSLPGDCKQLMHHTSCGSVPQTIGKPIAMRGYCSLLTFLQPHLKTRVTTTVGSGSCFGLHGSSWNLPRDANYCDAWTTLVCNKGHIQWFAALSKLSALGHQPKDAGSPVEVVLVEE